MNVTVVNKRQTYLRGVWAHTEETSSSAHVLKIVRMVMVGGWQLAVAPWQQRKTVGRAVQGP